MTMPLEFPDPQAEARRRAAEFQSRSPAERWRELGALMAFGWAMVRSSPRRQVIEANMLRDELKWRQIQEELFRRHGR
jgi:hypothetical protein